MLRNLGLAAILGLLWAALSGHGETLIVVLGIASVLLVVAFARRLDLLDEESLPLHLAWRAPSYCLWLLWQVVLSNVAVIRHILRARIDVDPQLVTVPSGQASDLGAVVYGNSITLTPGTVTIAIDGDQMLVHALDREAADSLVEGSMARRVAAFMQPS